MPHAVTTHPGPLSPAGKLRLAVRIWRLYLSVVVRTRRRPLPAVIEDLRHTAAGQPTGKSPAHLGTIVHRVLSPGPLRPRCLHSALVLFALLRVEAQEPDIVIGLPHNPTDQRAHAWVEVDGRDVGPPPGRGRHQELARYGPA